MTILNPAVNMETETSHIKPCVTFAYPGLRCHYGRPIGYVEGEYWYEMREDDGG